MNGSFPSFFDFDHGGCGGVRGRRANRNSHKHNDFGYASLSMTMHDCSLQANNNSDYSSNRNNHNSYNFHGDPQDYYDAPPSSFGREIPRDTLWQASTPGVMHQPRSQPGATLCSAHDAVSAKIATFGGNGGGQSDKSGNPAAAPQEIRILIAPGLTACLRGATETWACVEQDFYIPTSCFCCQAEICCIMDASYVLCPVCRVVSQLDNGVEDGGVGLGFTFEDLQQWQYKILLKRTQQPQH